MTASLELPLIVLEFMVEYSLRDVWCYENPGKAKYTFLSKHHSLHSRIDFILASENLAECMSLAVIGDKIISDHVTYQYWWNDQQSGVSTSAGVGF